MNPNRRTLQRVSDASDAGGPEGSSEPPRSRRGPSAATQDAVLGTAFRLIVTEGIAAVTPTRLHQETGVARTTVYRHWPDTMSVVADIVAGATRRDDVGHYTGVLDADLRTAVSTLTFRLANRPVGPLLGALLSFDTAEGGGRLAAGYVQALLQPVVDVLDGAVERGELDGLGAGSSAVWAADLCGPLFVRGLFGGEVIDDAAVARAVAAFLTARGAAAGRTMSGGG